MSMPNSTINTGTNNTTVDVHINVDWFDGKVLHRLDICLMKNRISYHLSTMLDDGKVLKTLKWYADIPKDVMPYIVSHALSAKTYDDFKALIDMIAPYRV